MFSKEDYIKYFLQIRKVEVTMYEEFGAFAEAVDDPALKKFFSDLQRQEKAHENIVNAMLKEFGYKI
jgi:rubrerythrin